MTKRRKKAAVAAAGIGAAAALAFLARAVFAAPDALSVIRYDSIGPGPDSVPAELFYVQLRDLVGGGFRAVAPARLRARVRWGRPLPERPYLLSIGEIAPEAATDVADALAEYGIPALVGPEVCALEGIGLSGAGGEARIGRGKSADPLSALPCIRATPGPLSFSVAVVRDAKDPSEFGTLRVSQPAGRRMPVSVLAYRPQDDVPFVQADAEELPRGEAGDAGFALPLPADAEFPLDVLVYDTGRVLLYHSVTVRKNSVVRPDGWREPLAGPDEEVEIEGL